LDGPGEYRFETRPGTVNVTISETAGRLAASLTSVEPRHIEAPDARLGGVLAALRWHRDALDPRIPPAIAFAVAWRPVLAAPELGRLHRLDYDYEHLKAVMLDPDLTTVQLVWREAAHVFPARNPFPLGGVVEDPATGAAAAALGGYLRAAHHVDVPCRVLIRQ